ncbi:ABC transporter permease [Dactylosporangium sp. CA-092794]|uniref:ABC transporter permease n=1 Tax=Dactylosporangium sp. CA-092794 TaxID=3239929 RepID=UPI003D8BF1B6
MTFRWLTSSLLLLFAVTVLTFVLSSLAPGNAVEVYFSGQAYTQEQYDQVEHQLGLDMPPPVRYWHWLTHAVRGDLGIDLFSGRSVTSELNARIGPSLSIIFGVLLLAAVVGVGFGVLSAVRGGALGRIVDVVAVLGFAVPNFWLAVVLIDLFSVQVRLLPSTGYVPFADDPVQWLRSLVLPVVALAVGTVALIARQVRDSVLRVLAKDFVTALRAHGLPVRKIVFKHVLRNAAIPIVTALGILFIGLLGGTVFVENVFGLPGIGQEAVSAGLTHNLPVIEGVALYFAILVVAINLLVDVSYRLLDPRARTAR